MLEHQLADRVGDDRLATVRAATTTRSAGAPGASPYLHRLFEPQETTAAGWIRQRRLERCRRDLLDPALAIRPVSAIADRWGFSSAAHFSRAFRAAYGVPPAEYRALGRGAR